MPVTLILIQITGCKTLHSAKTGNETGNHFRYSSNHVILTLEVNNRLDLRIVITLIKAIKSHRLTMSYRPRLCHLYKWRVCKHSGCTSAIIMHPSFTLIMIYSHNFLVSQQQKSKNILWCFF